MGKGPIPVGSQILEVAAGRRPKKKVHNPLSFFFNSPGCPLTESLPEEGLLGGLVLFAPGPLLSHFTWFGHGGPLRLTGQSQALDLGRSSLLTWGRLQIRRFRRM